MTDNEIRLKLSNWSSTASFIYSIKDPDMLLRILDIEKIKYNRKYNLRRIYYRYNNMRRIKEKFALPELVQDIKSDASLLSILVNQVKLFDYLSKIKEPTLELYKTLLKTEMEHSNRGYIKRVLYGRFYALRAKQEKAKYIC